MGDETGGIMTVGYFVEERGKQVIKAAEICGGAYLQNGRGEKILEAYAENREKEYLDSLAKETWHYHRAEIAQIWPGWYRKVGKKSRNRTYAEYGYVLRGENLYVYSCGDRLFTVNHGTADIWLKVIRQLERFEKTHLYSERRMEMQYDQEKRMFSMLQKRIDEGVLFESLEEELIPKDFEPLLLDDYHCVEVWRMDRVSYKKPLRIKGHEIVFFAERDYGKWRVLIQLPYVRNEILYGYANEKRAMEALRGFIREHQEELERFAVIFEYIKRLLKEACEQEDFDLKAAKEKISSMYLEKPWYCASSFSPEDIIKEIYGAWRRGEERRKEVREKKE